MAARKPDDILDGIVKQKGKDAKFRRKLAANKGRNWLLGITLNSFAKLDEGAPLSDLDNALVGAYRKNGFSDDELKTQGRLYRKMPAQLRDEVFPGKFA